MYLSSNIELSLNRYSYFNFNNRSVRVIDNAVAKDSVTSRLKVEDGNDLQVGAPMKGEVLDIKVAMGEVVEKGQGKYQTALIRLEMYEVFIANFYDKYSIS